MARRIAPLIAALAVSAWHPAQAAETVIPPAPTKAEQKRIKAVMRKAMIDSLRDADSAKTKNEFLSWSNTPDAPILSLCGNVNAKNAFGGYSGFERYIVSADGRIAIESSEPGSAIHYMWPIWCGRPLD